MGRMREMGGGDDGASLYASAGSSLLEAMTFTITNAISLQQVLRWYEVFNRTFDVVGSGRIG